MDAMTSEQQHRETLMTMLNDIKSDVKSVHNRLDDTRTHFEDKIDANQKELKSHIKDNYLDTSQLETVLLKNANEVTATINVRVDKSEKRVMHKIKLIAGSALCGSAGGVIFMTLRYGGVMVGIDLA